MAKVLKAGVAGVGYLGRFHAQKYAALPDSELVGVFDASPERCREIAAELGVKAFESLDAMSAEVELVSAAATTSAHFAVAKQCLEAKRHILIEKPISPTVGEAEELVRLAAKHDLIMQVGYLERFNPAFLQCVDKIGQPQFIEAIRIASFLERGADVDVVLDLMSHDLDLVLSIAKAPVKELHAVGKSLMTDSTDLANVRIIFEDGCVANMTASRISSKVERKLRVFQQDSYFSLDFAEPSVRIIERVGEGQGLDAFSGERIKLEKADALLAEIKSFLQAVRGECPPAVSGWDGLRAMRVAESVMADIAKNQLP